VWGLWFERREYFNLQCCVHLQNLRKATINLKKIPTWNLPKVLHYSINYTPVLDRWFVNRLWNIRIRSKTGLTTSIFWQTERQNQPSQSVRAHCSTQTRQPTPRTSAAPSLSQEQTTKAQRNTKTFYTSALRGLTLDGLSVRKNGEAEKNCKQMETWQAIHKSDSSKSDSRDGKITILQKICCSSYWCSSSPPATFLNIVITFTLTSVTICTYGRKKSVIIAF